MLNGYQLLYLFFFYSFIGWVLETAAAAIREKRYVDRSVLFGPICVIYGFNAVIMALLVTPELKEAPVLLFAGSAIYATVTEWLTGHALEHLTGTRWWDYSGHFANLDGMISLPMSLIWGGLGLSAVYLWNPFLLRLYAMAPSLVSHLTLLILLGVFLLDVFGSWLTMIGLVHRLPRLEALDNRLELLAVRIGVAILGRTERRIQRAHPLARLDRRRVRKASLVFAEGCCFYKLFLLFVIGSFLGDITETIFCRLRGGVWMSRSSLVWGPFSIVWGAAIALVTLLLYRYKDRSDRFLFLSGTLLGGAYEYLCSVASELVFGTVFWDYSDIPFNLGGRINLLYCFFWGFAALIWFRALYPPISSWIERIPIKAGAVITWCLVFFMSCNIVVSSLALMRYSTRSAGTEPTQNWEVWMDVHYPDERMQQIYPNAMMVN